MVTRCGLASNPDAIKTYMPLVSGALATPFHEAQLHRHTFSLLLGCVGCLGCPPLPCQDYIAAVYDLSVAYPDVPVFQTAADVVGAGTATARSQYYGSANNRSLWLGGMFDYRGLSDYTPIKDQVLDFAYFTREFGWYLIQETTATAALP